MSELVEDLKIANDNLYCANKMLEKEIEILHSIIKEVREYIENNTYKIEWGDLEQDNEDININEDLTEKEFIEGLLDILDKEK